MLREGGIEDEKSLCEGRGMHRLSSLLGVLPVTACTIKRHNQGHCRHTYFPNKPGYTPGTYTKRT